MLIGGLVKSSLLDYPKKLSAVVFTVGCNFKCGYCHNPNLINFKKESPILNVSDFFEFLKTRKGKLDGVVITGGEPTLQDDLEDFIKEIKNLGFLVKLDTNGTNPKTLKTLCNNSLIDYIAMDIKASFEKYNKITKTFVDIDKIKESINFIMNCGVDYEFRTTVLKSQLNFDDFRCIGNMIKGAKKYYLQKFVPSEILDKLLINEKTYSDLEFQEIISELKNYIEFVDVR